MMHVVPDCGFHVQIPVTVTEEGRAGVVEHLCTHFAQGIRDLLLLADVSRIERDVVIPLDNVKYGHSVAAREEGFNHVAPEEAAAADDQVDVFRAL